MPISNLTHTEFSVGVAVAVADSTYLQSGTVHSVLIQSILYGVLAFIGSYFGKKALSQAGSYVPTTTTSTIPTQK